MIRIQLKELTQQYRVIRERPDSLREAFTKVFRQHSAVQIFSALKHIDLDVQDGETTYTANFTRNPAAFHCSAS